MWLMTILKQNWENSGMMKQTFPCMSTSSWVGVCRSLQVGASFWWMLPYWEQWCSRKKSKSMCWCPLVCADLYRSITQLRLYKAYEKVYKQDNPSNHWPNHGHASIPPIGEPFCPELPLCIPEDAVHNTAPRTATEQWRGGRHFDNTKS